MLNLLISILGNSYDEFQQKSDIFDFKEMTETVREIEYIKNLFRPANEYRYLSICVNPYDEGEDDWGGRVKEIKTWIDKSQKKIETKINSIKINEIEIQNKFDQLDNRFNGFDNMLNSLNDKLKNIEGKLDDKLENIANLLSRRNN